MLGSVLRHARRRGRVVAAVALAGCSGACTAAVSEPAHAAWGSAPKPPVPDGSAPDPRSTHPDAFMKQALAGILKHGMPSKENIKYRDGYCLAYDRATRNPRWVSFDVGHQVRGSSAALNG